MADEKSNTKLTLEAVMNSPLSASGSDFAIDEILARIDRMKAIADLLFLHGQPGSMHELMPGTLCASMNQVLQDLDIVKVLAKNISRNNGVRA